MEGTMNTEPNFEVAPIPKIPPKRHRQLITPTPPPESTTPESLMRLAIERNLDVDKLEKIMAMQIRWEQAQAKRAFDEAMVAVKLEPDLKIIKDQIAKVQSAKGGYEYKFPKLDQCCEVIIPVLAKHGIYHNWEPAQTDGLVAITCWLTHISGHSKPTTLKAAPDDTGGKNAVQAVGSTTSYLERYTLLASVGVCASDMPNGERGEGLSELPPNPFAQMAGEEFKAAFESRWKAAKTKAEKHLILDWKNSRQKELTQ
jgi:hypothetical protein